MNIKKIKAVATVTRMDFLKDLALVMGAAIAPPIIVTEKVFDANAPSNRLGQGG